MSNTTKTSRDTKRIEEDKTDPRGFYRKPHLEELGDLRSLTLGGSPGIGDSGGGGTPVPEFPPGASSHPLLPPEY